MRFTDLTDAGYSRAGTLTVHVLLGLGSLLVFAGIALALLAYPHRASDLGADAAFAGFLVFLAGWGVALFLSGRRRQPRPCTHPGEANDTADAMQSGLLEAYVHAGEVSRVCFSCYALLDYQRHALGCAVVKGRLEARLLGNAPTCTCHADVTDLGHLTECPARELAP